MDVPLISVVMANYNGGSYLPLAVDSIVSQSCGDFEFIIVDDCSTDDSRRYLRSLRDPRIRLIEGDQNQGQACSLNLGLEAARGRYIARMDADDISEPIRFEKQVQFLECRPEIGIVGTQARLIGCDGVDCGRSYLPNDSDSVWAYGFLQNPFVHPSVIFRAELVRNEGLRFNEAVINQDFELWSRLLTDRRGANLPQCLIRYRVHPNSMTIRHHEENLRSSVAIIRGRLSTEGLDNLMTDQEVDVLLRYVFADRRIADEAGVDRAALGWILWRVTMALHKRRIGSTEFVDLVVRRLVQSCLWPRGAQALGSRFGLMSRSIAEAPASWWRFVTLTAWGRASDSMDLVTSYLRTIKPLPMSGQ